MRHLKIIFGLLIITLLIGASASAQVLISKIQTSGASATDEFVELYNNSSSSAPLAGLTLKKQTSGGTIQMLISSFPASAVINPFSYFLIAHTNYQPINGITSDFTYTNSSNSLADNNVALLVGPNGEILDSVFWGTITSTNGSPAPNPDKFQALVRLPNDASGNGVDTDNNSADFIIAPSAPFNSASPARPTIATTTAATSTTEKNTSTTTANNEAAPDYSVLKINEAMPNPASGNEWVELYNVGSVEINLAGISICDATSATSSCKTASGTIAGNGFVQIDLGTARYLNNDGDSVRLFDQKYELLDAVSYSGDLIPESGQALARKIDGADTGSLNDWAISTVPTPVSPNIIIAPVAPAPKATSHTSGGGGLAPGVIVSAPAATTTERATTSPKIIIPDPVRLTLKVMLPTVAAPGELINFSAKGSADPRGGIISYHWNFGDSATADSASAEHAFATSGVYTVTLSATSTAGTVGHTAKTITIAPEFYTASGTIIFSEILANPLGDENTDEFIELQNTSSSPVSIAGWHLVLGKNAFTIPTGSSIPTGSFAVFYRTVTHLALANAKEQTITLTNAAGTVKDALRLPAGEAGLPPSESEGASYARFSDVWQWSNAPTPGLPNALVAGEKIIAPVVEAGQKNITAKTNSASRTRTNKTPAVFKGAVTAPPGIYGQRLVYVANSDGGLLVQVPPKWSVPLPLGAAVKVSGRLTETAAGKIYLKAKDIKIENQASRPVVAATTTGEELPDAARGALISFTGDITELKKNYAIIDDTEGEIRAVFKTGAHITKTRLTPGLRVTITGALEENNNGRELWPRGDEDIQILSAAPAAPKAAPSSPAVTYGATTVGGMALLTVARRLRRAKFFTKLLKKEVM